MTTAAIHVSEPDAATRRGKFSRRSAGVEREARAVVAQHNCFRGRVDGFEFVERDDVLTVRGCVPSFYLKQVLQTMLKRLDGVGRVDNQVDVICCYGLSSVRDD